MTQAAEGAGHRLDPNAASPMPVRHIEFPTSRHGLPQHSRIAQPFPSAVPTAVTAHAVSGTEHPVHFGQQQHMHASASGKLPASAAAASSSRAVIYVNPTAVPQLPQQLPQQLPGSVAQLSHVSWPQPVVGWPQQSTGPHDKGQPSGAVTALTADLNHFQQQFVQSSAGLPGPVPCIGADVHTKPAVAQQGAGVGSLASVPQQQQPEQAWQQQQQQPQQAWQQQPQPQQQQPEQAWQQQQQPQQAWQQQPQPQQQQPEQAWRQQQQTQRRQPEQPWQQQPQQQPQPQQLWQQQQQQQEGVHTGGQLDATGTVPQAWQPGVEAQAAATAQRAEASYKRDYSAVPDGRLGAQAVAPAATANGDVNVQMQTEVVPSNKR